MAEERLLLDTCALIFSALGSKISRRSEDALNAAADGGQLRVSLISAWEIGMSMAKGRIASPLSALDFFNRYVNDTGTGLCDLSAKILTNATTLPGVIHGDPLDRIIVATAREHDLTVVTRDRGILAYGAAGHVKTLEC
jgi:PIN domain nuclease of toxin-antitoxin system